MNSYSTEEMNDTEKITIGIDVFPSIFRMKDKILGDNNENVEYILNETGAVMTLRGKGSGFIDFKENKESDEPLHIHVRYKNMDAREKTRELILNLIDTVQQDFISSTYGKYYSPPKKPEIIPVSLNKVRRTSSYNSLSSRSPVRSIERSVDRRSMEKRSVDNRISLEPRSYESRAPESRPYEKRSSLEPRPYEKRSSLEPRPYEKRSSLEPRPYGNRVPEPRSYDNRHPESRPFESRTSETRSYDSRPPEPRPFESRVPEPRTYDDRTPEPRPFDSRPAEPNPFENRSSEARPYEKRKRESRFDSRPVEPTPFESRAVEPRPFESRPVESRPFESRTVEPRTFENRTVESRPFESRTVEPRPFESRTVEPRPFESRPVESRPFEKRTVEPRPFENRTVEPRSFESRPAEPKPFENRPAEPRPFENRLSERKSVENPLPDSTKPSPGENITSNIEKITIGIESVPPAFNLKSKIYGPNLANVKHIEKVANALLLVEGKGCGVNSSGEESQEPPYILVKYLKPELKDVARNLIFNLIETIQQEYIQLYGRYPGGPQKPQIVPIKKLVNDKPPPAPVSIKMKIMSSDITPVPPPPPVISKTSSPDRFDNVPPPANFGITIPKSLSPKLFANAEPTPVPKPVQPVVPSTTNTYNPLAFQRVPEPNPLPVVSPLLSGIGSQSSILNSVLSSQPRLRQPGSFVTSETSQAQIQTIQNGKIPVEILDDSLEILANGQESQSLIESCKPRPRNRGANSRKNNRNRKKTLQKNYSEKRPKSPIESAATEAKRFCSTGVGILNTTIPTKKPPRVKQHVPTGKNPFQRNLIPITVDKEPTTPAVPVATNSMKAPPTKPVVVSKPAPTTPATNKPLPGILKKPQWNDIRNGNNREKSDSEDEGLVSNPIILSDSEDEELNQRRNTVRISATVTKNEGRDISVQTDDKLYQTQIKNIKCACGRFMHVVTGVRSVETQTIGGDSFRRF